MVRGTLGAIAARSERDQKRLSMGRIRRILGRDPILMPLSPGSRCNFFLGMCEAWDARLMLRGVLYNIPMPVCVELERKKLMTKKRVGPEGSDSLNDLDYYLINVSRSKWVGPLDAKGNRTYSKDVADAAMFKRIEALDQFIEACRNNATDYDVPVRVRDLVACQMGLDET